MKVTIDGHIIEGTPEEIKGYFELFVAKFPVDAEPKETKEAEESTPKFKEGDRVKALADGEDGDIETGEIGTIESISESARDDGDPYYIFVETDDDRDYFRPQDLELVTEEEVGADKPKVGVKVEVVKCLDGTKYGYAGWGKVGQGLIKIGAIGEIVEVKNHGIYVKFSEEQTDIFINASDRERFFLKDGEYKVICAEETPPKPTTIKRKARVGERILITEPFISCGEYRKGDEFTVNLSVEEGGGTNGHVKVEGIGTCILDKEYEVIVVENTRKPGEFKKGDIVRAKRTRNGEVIVGEIRDEDADGAGNLAVTSFVDGQYRAIIGESIELIAPVEARVDKPKGNDVR